MDQPSTVDILESFQELVENVLLVNLLQQPIVGDVEDITLHILKDKIDVLFILRLDDFEEFDHIEML